MTKKKKNTRNQSQKNQSINFSSEYNNLIVIFLGIFLLYSLNSNSMGFSGKMIQEIFKGLFGALSMFIPVMIIVMGALGFFDYNEYIFKFRKSKVSYIVILFIFVFYGLLNSNLVPVDSPFRPEMIGSIMKAGVNENGLGLVASIMVYYIKQMFGITGGWLISLFVLFLSIIFVFNISIKDLILSMRQKSVKTKSGEVDFKERLQNLKQSALDMVSDEVDDYDDEIEKTGFFKKIFNKKNKKQGIKLDLDQVDEVDDKTIKIVGFNKAEDDFLEIHEAADDFDDDYEEVIKPQEYVSHKSMDDTNINLKRNTNNQDFIFKSEKDIKVETKNSTYKKPPLDLLNDFNSSKSGNRHVRDKSRQIVTTLKNFNIEIERCVATFGPTITRYEISPKPGTKVSKIVNLSDDLALSLAAKSIRIEAPIPGKPAIGIEVPNDSPNMVGLKEVLSSNNFKNEPSSLAVALGQEISGNSLIADLVKMPHLLIAGATGSGKSVCVNTIITSLLYKSSPDEVKLLLIDPKVVELAHYNGIPHLLSPVVTDPKKAANALNWAVNEMNKRYTLFAENGVKDITSYNKKCENKLYKIVIIIDELADLMMACGNDVEDYICRIAQMARAAGMHLIIATQRPSVDVITGVIKANIPSRIAFAVSSQTDSRTILDMGGAEKLLGKGDMLYYPLGAAKPLRIQGAFITEEESEKVIDYIKSETKEDVEYEEEILDTISNTTFKKESDEDEILEDAIEFVVLNNQASASMLQRKFKIGFNRAARLIDSMEERNIIGASEGSRPRKVLITVEELRNLKKDS